MYVNELVSAELGAHSAYLAKPKSFRAKVYAQLGRIRFQILGGLLAAVVVPALAFDPFQPAFEVNRFFFNTLLGTLWAFLLGYLIFRKVTAYPGVRATAYILAAFMVSYAITVVIFFMLRLDYSRTQFAISFALTAAFFYAIFFVARRAHRLELSVVPVGNLASLKKLSTFVGWREIATPEEMTGTNPIVADFRADLSPEWERFITDSALAGRPVYDLKQVVESLSGRVEIEKLSENTFGALSPNAIYAAAKRHSDFLFAVIALIVLLPFLLIVAALIKLTSRGPALFRQQRMGFRGHPFTVYKFRTMREADPAAADRSSEMTAEHDPRITGFGQFLRRTRIDELPQLINILRGEMSWIGPRPESMKLSQWYEGEIPFYRYRHLVRPGITGWAQVSQGHVTSVEDAHLKLQFDFFYVKNFSLWLDMLVLLRTFRVVLTGQGAK